MLTAIATIITGIAGILAFIKWVIPAFQKPPAQVDADIDKQMQDDKAKAKETGRPV